MVAVVVVWCGVACCGGCVVARHEGSEFAARGLRLYKMFVRIRVKFDSIRVRTNLYHVRTLSQSEASVID